AEFPLTPNKKVDRAALPEPEQRLSSSYLAAEAVRDSTELRVLKIWEDVLRLRQLALDQNFFDAGGHSLLAAQLIQKIEQAFGTRLTMAAVFQAPTVRQMAALLRGQTSKLPVADLIPLQPRGTKPPFFCICVDAGPMYLNLLKHFDPQRPFLGVEPTPMLLHHVETPYQMEAIATILVRAIRDFQHAGPYYLGGYCISGLLAYEVARVLESQGHQVAAVGMFLTSNPAPRSDFSK